MRESINCVPSSASESHHHHRCGSLSPSLRLPAVENKENEGDLKISASLASSSSSAKEVKNFKAPTISAASRAVSAAASPRRRILREKNETTREMGGEVSTVDLDVKNRHSSGTLAYPAADPSLPPYDPHTNYLSPRPQFLYYRPRPKSSSMLDKSLLTVAGDVKQLEYSFSEDKSDLIDEEHSSSNMQNNCNESLSSKVDAVGSSNCGTSVPESTSIPESESQSKSSGKSRSFSRYMFVSLLLIFVTTGIYGFLWGCSVMPQSILKTLPDIPNLDQLHVVEYLAGDGIEMEQSFEGDVEKHEVDELEHGTSYGDESSGIDLVETNPNETKGGGIEVVESENKIEVEHRKGLDGAYDHVTREAMDGIKMKELLSDYGMDGKLATGLFSAFLLLVSLAVYFLINQKKNTPVLEKLEKSMGKKVVFKSLAGNIESYGHAQGSPYEGAPMEILLANSLPSEFSGRLEYTTSLHTTNKEGEDETLMEVSLMERDSTTSSSSSISYGGTINGKGSEEKVSKDVDAMIPVRRSSRLLLADGEDETLSKKRGHKEKKIGFFVHSCCGGKDKEVVSPVRRSSKHRSQVSVPL